MVHTDLTSTISKEYRFEAAHRLRNHNGQCARLHGHSYRVEVKVRGQVSIEDSGASDYCMVVDFSELDAIMRPLIDALDHRFLVPSKEVAQYAPSWLEPGEMASLPVARTTAEELARYIVSVLMAPTSSIRMFDIGVTVWETAKASAHAGTI